ALCVAGDFCGSQTDRWLDLFETSKTRECERGFRASLAFLIFLREPIFARRKTSVLRLPHKERKTIQMKVCPVCGKEYSDTSSLCTLDAEVLQSVDDPLVGQTLAGK